MRPPSYGPVTVHAGTESAARRRRTTPGLGARYRPCARGRGNCTPRDGSHRQDVSEERLVSASVFPRVLNIGFGSSLITFVCLFTAPRTSMDICNPKKKTRFAIPSSRVIRAVQHKSTSAPTRTRNANSRADEHHAALLQLNVGLLPLPRRTERPRALCDDEDRWPVKPVVRLPPAGGQHDLHDQKLRHGRAVHFAVLCRRCERRGGDRMRATERPGKRREQVVHFGVRPARRTLSDVAITSALSARRRRRCVSELRSNSAK